MLTIIRKSGLSKKKFTQTYIIKFIFAFKFFSLIIYVFFANPSKEKTKRINRISKL